MLRNRWFSPSDRALNTLVLTDDQCHQLSPLLERMYLVRP